MDVISEFDRVYIGDSFIEKIELNLAKERCVFFLDHALLLKNGSSDIFDPAERFTPAILILEGVVSISFLEGNYYFNTTIIDFKGTLLKNNLVEFTFTMTGGIDNESFIRTIIVIAKNFTISSAI